MKPHHLIASPLRRAVRNASHGVLGTAALVLLASQAEAAISIVDRFDSTSTVDGFDYTFSGSTLDFTGASKLVVAVGSEGSANNGAQPTAISQLTYGGVPLIQIVPTGPATNQNRTSLFYLDLASVSFTGTDFFLDFVDDVSNNRGYGFTAYTLSGTKDGVSASSTLRLMTTETDITTLTDNEFLIGSWSRNSSGQFPVFPDGSPLANDFTAGLEAQYSFAAVSGQLGPAGVYDFGLADIANDAGRFVIATFQAVPEPSTALLGGLALLTLLRRRR